MKKFVLLFFAICIFYGCKKDDTPGNNFDSFPGALDSVLYYSNNTADSANYSGTYGSQKFLYDTRHRVARIQYSDYTYRNFYYQGTNMLPFLQVDSSYASVPPDPNNYRMDINYHQLAYDNQNRLTLDSCNSYNRVKYSAAGPVGIENNIYYSYRYSYLQDFMTYKDSRTTFYNKDTTFFNAAGDINKLEFYNSPPYNQYVTEYSTDMNPLSTLNIAPLYPRTPLFFNLIPIYLNFPALQPKFLYKKLSGKNHSVYRGNKDDIIDMYFYPKKDSNNRITHLVIAYYTRFYNAAGVNYHTIRYYFNFRYFYQQ